MMRKFFPQFTVWLYCLILFTTALSQSVPPKEQNKREAHLIELIKLDPTIKLDIRYATADNFVGKQVYPEARAFLQKPAAKALLEVHKKLRKQGLGLVIFDGYRPWAITKLFGRSLPKKSENSSPTRKKDRNTTAAVRWT